MTPKPQTTKTISEVLDILIELADEHFPKGISKERGEAMVMVALAIPRLEAHIAEARADERQAMLDALPEKQKFPTASEWDELGERDAEVITDIAVGFNQAIDLMEAAIKLRGEAMNCVFCQKIEEGSVGYVTENVVSFEPLNPVTEGHLLFVPVKHVEDFTEDPETSSEVIKALASVSSGYTDVNLITSKGEHATQTIKHLHFHVVPREEEDGLYLPWTPKPNGGSDEH